MAEHDIVYVVDTSSWLQIEGHPDENRILDALYNLVEAGKMKSPPEVFKELSGVGSVTGWLKLNKSAIVEGNRSDLSYFGLVGEITHKFPGMAGARGMKNKADPYVVALAKHLTSNPTKGVVVCDESLNRRPNRKIPTACAQYGVECFGMMDLLRKEFPDDDW